MKEICDPVLFLAANVLLVMLTGIFLYFRLRRDAPASRQDRSSTPAGA